MDEIYNSVTFTNMHQNLYPVIYLDFSELKDKTDNITFL
jgi:hypothetical protein